VLTPEQKKASDWLGESIKDFMDQLGYNDGTMVITDWVICVAQQGYDEAGEGKTGVSYLVKDEAMSWHRILGLVEAVRLRMQVNFNAEGEAS